MREVSFGEFFEAVKHKIPSDRLVDLKGFQVCVEHDGTYLSLYVDKQRNGLWLSWVVGEGLAWAREIKEACLDAKVELVGFVTKTDNKAVNSLARYFKANIIKQEGDFVHYEIDLYKTR